MRLIKIILVMVTLWMFWHCENKSGPLAESQQPQIIAARIDTAWNISGSDRYIVEVAAQDPQGSEDLTGAYLTVLDAGQAVIFTGNLYDDGSYIHPNSQDVIAGDGVFRNVFSAGQISSVAGEYLFRVVVEDANGNQSEQIEQYVVFNRSSPLLMNMVWAPDSLFAMEKIFRFSAEVVDTSGSGGVISAWFDLAPSGGTVSLQRYTLYNDGDVMAHGDDVANDSLFNSLLDTSFAAGRKGLYDLRFQAQNEFGSKSNIRVRPVYIDNQPGVIYNTQMPSEVTRPARMTFKAWISDPQSLADVDSVYIMLQDSQGHFTTNSSGQINRILLYDDGNDIITGDEVKGDGIYSRILQVTADNNADSYTIYFYMRDRAGNLSTPRLGNLTIN